MRKPARQRTTIIARSLEPWRSSVTHDRHDLIDRRWVGRVAHALVARWAAGVVAGQCRRRATPPRGVERWYGGHEDLLGSDSRYAAALHGRRRPGYRSPRETERRSSPGLTCRDDRDSSVAGVSRASAEATASRRREQRARASAARRPECRVAGSGSSGRPRRTAHLHATGERASKTALHTPSRVT